MSDNIVPRYQPTYRANEIDLVTGLAQRGQSMGFIGISGIGKSNLVNFLHETYQEPSPEQEEHKLRFPVVDATQWQGSPTHLWQMMLEALNKTTKNLSSPPSQNDKIIPISEDERVMKLLQERIQWVCQELGYRVMLILDDFDGVIKKGPLPMLERLNGLRSEGNRGLLSYLVFTKKLPHILGYRHNLEDGSKFYDLFRHHIYALEPYSQADAMTMLTHLNDLAGKPLRADHLAQIYLMAGGHPMLLKIVFNIWVAEGAKGIRANYFATKSDVKQECRRIFINLHVHEQEVALRAARNQHKSDDMPVLAHLKTRGIVTNINPIAWFSPLMLQFLNTYTTEVAS